VEWVLRERPRVKDGVRALRRFRTGKRPAPADAHRLAEEILRLLDDYATRHPDTTPETERAALRMVRWAVDG
jgi:hypothetical protein